jgi:hypothetical protein
VPKFVRAAPSLPISPLPPGSPFSYFSIPAGLISAELHRFPGAEVSSSHVSFRDLHQLEELGSFWDLALLGK